MLIGILLLWICQVVETESTVTENKFLKVPHGETLDGSIAFNVTVRSSLQCSDRCSSDPACIAYQLNKNTLLNCAGIHQGSELLVSDAGNRVYKRKSVCTCLNGGTCTGNEAPLTCNCTAGFTGAKCEVNINDCSPIICQNGGTCVDGINSYTCSCVAGFNESNCQNNIDDCSPNPCMNSGVCQDGVNSYQCDCSVGFTGQQCETNIDDCLGASPCQNSGTCVDGVNTYTCACQPGYDGLNCQNNIDECQTSACLNEGTCVDGINSFQCICVSGFTGESCETNIDDCPATNACQNGGSCVDRISVFHCACVPGYTGDNCETDVDECSGNPCQNDGTCTDGMNSFICNCITGFTGTNCENNSEDCPATEPCLNGGTCQDGINTYSCNCVPGFTGQLCETNIDECGPNPCQNGGVCTDQINSYTCGCASGYDGATCTTDCSVSWCEPAGWTSGDPPQIYNSFSSSTGLTMNDLSQHTPNGKTGYGVMTDRSKGWTVGFNGLACITDPPTCTGGATLTVWVKILDCPDKSGFLSSRQGGDTGFRISCSASEIKFQLYITTGKYNPSYTPKLTNTWFHITMLVHTNGAGLTVYHNGNYKASDTSLDTGSGSLRTPGTGEVEIGLKERTKAQDYASVVIDDLYAWNRLLFSWEITIVMNM